MAFSKKKSEICLMSDSKTKHPGANHPVHSTQTIWCAVSITTTTSAAAAAAAAAATTTTGK